MDSFKTWNALNGLIFAETEYLRKYADFMDATAEYSAHETLGTTKGLQEALNAMRKALTNLQAETENVQTVLDVKMAEYMGRIVAPL